MNNPEKSMDVVFRDEFDGDVRFNVAVPKLTKHDEKWKILDGRTDFTLL